MSKVSIEDNSSASNNASLILRAINASNQSKVAEQLEQRRAELRKAVKPQPMPVDAYVASVKVNFVAVIERQFYKLKGVA